MKIGVMVYSYTGNTLSVAMKLQDALTAKGHDVAIERVVPDEDKPQARVKTTLINAPEVAPYDALVFASPVYGFELAPAMQLYLSQLGGLADKKVSCFVTMSFKFKRLGGHRAIRQIAAACAEKGSPVLQSGIVSWGSKEREREISEVVSALSAF
ncbi:MAG TPA: hypothetical protein VN369_00830 [Terriglobales bacterium]|nr:hypothetical protein [Terriglobales bacterium]